MYHATLLVITGTNRGTRFDLSSERDFLVGRSVGCDIRLDDSEVSRHHIRINHNGDCFRLTDLQSANGTRINGHIVVEQQLQNGDTLQLGNSVLSFQLQEPVQTPIPSAAQVCFVEEPNELSEASIIQSLPVHAPSPAGTDSAALDLMYQVAEELVAPVLASEIRLQRILQLTLDAIGADHGCFLLSEQGHNELRAVAFARSEKTEAGSDQMLISRSITSVVLRDGTALRTTNASADDRFSTGQSIVSEGIREAVCAPLRGRAGLLGVLYLDTRTALTDVAPADSPGRLSDEHLRMVVTVARQTALAMESRQFQDAMVRAERFAAMGQTITVLSHHIKNILQGVRGGSHLIQNGLESSDSDLIRSGWNIVERNQNRIYHLVMDMLSFSKDRVPVLQTADLNDVVSDVCELATGRAEEAGVRLEFRRNDEIPPAQFDHEGMHRALLNIVSNAIDAAEDSTDGAVVVQTGYDIQNDSMLVAISDNGPGIPLEVRHTIFNVFESSKGSRGTGIGLPVSRKILREHGGKIQIEGEPGEGTRFVLSWPRGIATIADPSLAKSNRVT